MCMKGPDKARKGQQSERKDKGQQSWKRGSEEQKTEVTRKRTRERRGSKQSDGGLDE